MSKELRHSLLSVVAALLAVAWWIFGCDVDQPPPVVAPTLLKAHPGDPPITLAQCYERCIEHGGMRYLIKDPETGKRKCVCVR
jgi:hypothetical protein